MTNQSDPKTTVELQNIDKAEADENGQRPGTAGRQEQTTPKAGAVNQDAATKSGAIQEATQRITKQSADVIRFGIRAVTEAQAPLMEASAEHSRRLVDQISSVAGTYYDAVQQTSPYVLALVKSVYAFSYGMQQNQNASLAMLRSSMDGLYRRRETFTKINAPEELAKLQSDIYLDVINVLYKGYTTLWQNVAQITEETLEPLQAQQRQ